MNAELLAQAQRLTNLERVLQWAFSLTPAGTLVEIVTQDEYTHDVILLVPSLGYLVFDTS